ncbi:hypothetical protein QIS99_18770 [Streptomyces sp. B-S-A8]|uniref:Uncharacterized protein n=1 Tax=Streptomyces solicavernae TaxID=3043614 RepID=A0ABT6RUW7_9ACTN|nr:hypothetical protein [Streptomyces sp. B-S-A8]MDI3388232.1 hypothetical protein [Streptomyces sp. B-S-A8]
MIAYAMTVRRWWVVAPTLALIVFVCLAVGASEVPVPSLVGGMTGARLDYFAPILAVIAVMYCMDRRLPEPERTAVVPVRRLDRAAIAITSAFALGSGALIGMDIARNLVLLVSLALLVRRVANEATAAATGMALLVASLVAGRAYQPGGSTTHTWWALPLYSAGSVTAWLATLCLFALALFVSCGDSGFSGPRRS